MTDRPFGVEELNIKGSGTATPVIEGSGNIAIKLGSSTSAATTKLYIGDSANIATGEIANPDNTTVVNCGILTANKIFGTLVGGISVTANNSTNETVYPLFVDGTTGTQDAETDLGLTYNPSSNLLKTSKTELSSDLKIDSTRNAFSGNETYQHDTSNEFIDYHLGLRNSNNDTGKAIGIAFQISSNSNSVGGAIAFTRTASTSKGDLIFLTKNSTIHDDHPVEKFRIKSNGAICFGDDDGQPDGYGTSGHVLTSNGDGPPTWQASSGGDGSFTVANQSSNYTLQESDLGKLIIIDGNDVTIPVNTFSAGDTISIFNKAGITTSSIIPGTNVTAYLGGSNVTGITSLAAKGIANVLCTEDVNNADVFIVTGQGLS